MPSKVSNINKLKAWGHGPLNGNIEIDSKNEVKFSVDRLNKNKMLEVRIVTTEEQFKVSPEKEKKYRYLQSIIEEELRLVK